MARPMALTTFRRAAVILLTLASMIPGSRAEGENGAAPPGPLGVKGPILPAKPATGKGRLAVAFSGNRRWCTYPDDRVVRLPEGPDQAEQKKNAVYTFGYQFSIAAVERSSPQTTILLFESPIVRTAAMRQVAKIPGPRKPAVSGPKIITDLNKKNRVLPETSPGMIVPYWMEQYRCTSVSDRFDFDLDPGVYDVYIAFDLLTRGGGWVHRSTGYLTDINVAAGQRTVVEGAINLTAGGNREVALLGSSLQASDYSPGAVVP